ncbi:patatin-domain-containing protein [Gloeophyllum trabeum ATCC 11539]|uniref:Patatin-like phospholipase domain-containing protein n=1 Tax=Gloeophyllum trabeum (strain ATCC 11539 / FP-39264 / Madison 617) TaxID=670483 RepID=S7RX96_GLOTA|nr:patatin-domain-containing protein [Gloeophyllum trabeum ATCC 11539]EPQ59500.1 patatin-domain-containing protein [Gloeophyllum trabeum ATCC 11539]
MQTFAEALNSDDIVTDANDPPTPTSHPGGAPTPHGERVRKVSALSDFAPVNVKVHKRRRKESGAPDRRQDLLFIIVRWPLLIIIFAFILAEFGFYVLIRQLVNTQEWLSAWRGRRGQLRKQLRAAKTYEEWKQVALELDEYMRFNQWKTTDEDPFYDWRLVRKVRRSLKTLREKDDARGILGVLETCIRNNFAGIESPRLYSETFYGTKNLIEDYINEQEKALRYVLDTSHLSKEEKRRFFKTVNTNLGASALCLSGGASFGYYHLGVVKAFLDAGLLPRVITGTSAGGLIAALVCTRTDDELKRLLVPELANRITACEEPFSVWFKRFWKTGARFDAVSWAKKATFFTRGSLTFREAYMRTGRILNISVIPADRHSPTKLLNYMTAPDTIIWTALLASAAVPGILNPVVLMQKTRDGRIVPWNWGSKFKDGSLRVDIPLQSLNLYFNVTHPVVSQVNPHVHLFFFAPRGSPGKPVAHRKGKGWRGNFLLSAGEQWLKLELTKNFKVIRDLELLPQLLGQDWSSVFLQRFEGVVTIWPRTRVKDWFHILSDPDPPELARMMQAGQIATWPKLHMVENRFRLEKQIYEGRQAIRKAMQMRGKDVGVIRQEQEQPQDSTVPDPVTGTRVPHIDVTDPSSPPKTEMPLAMDTDAEAAFAQRSERFFKRPRHHTSPRTSTISAKQDLLISPSVRRRWVSELFDHAPSGPAMSEKKSPEPEGPRPANPPSPTSALLTRFRKPSFQMMSPFSSMRKKEQVEEANEGEEEWGSDSSSSETFIVEHNGHTQSPVVLPREVQAASSSSEDQV